MESAFNSCAVSPKGACGILQVMPDTAILYGVSRKELFNEDINIQVGLHYLKEMFQVFGNHDLAIAAYNCGPTRVMDAGYRIPRIEETREFVRRVNDAWRYYERERYSQGVSRDGL